MSRLKLREASIELRLNCSVFACFFWTELLQIFPTKKWMVAAAIFLWYSQLF